MAQRLAGGSRSSTGSVEATARVLAFWTFVLLALCLVAAVALSEPYAAARAAQRRLDYARRANQYLADGNGRLRAEMEAIQNDPFYAERLVRVDLSWQRPGERVLRLPAPGGPIGRSFPPPSVARDDWLAGVAERLARNPKQRAVTLAAAGLLFLVAFACFADPRRPACAATDITHRAPAGR